MNHPIDCPNTECQQADCFRCGKSEMKTEIQQWLIAHITECFSDEYVIRMKPRDWICKFGTRIKLR